MARPREFAERDILDKALVAFWSKGFDGTSIEDLVKATGLGRASLYGAFGDKEHLFRRVLDHYLERVEQAAVATEGRPLREVLPAIFAAQVGASCPKTGPRGCFLLLSGTSGGSAELVQDVLQKSAARTQRAFAALLKRAQSEGELTLRADTAALARFLVVVQHGIATSARAGVSLHDLQRVAAEAVTHVMSFATHPTSPRLSAKRVATAARGHPPCA